MRRNFGGNGMQPPDKWTGGIYNGIALPLQGIVDGGRYPMGAQHDSDPSRCILRRFDNRDTLSRQLLHDLPIVDQLTQCAGGLFGCAFFRQLQCPAYPEAEAGGFGNGHLHLIPPICRRI